MKNTIEDLGFSDTTQAVSIVVFAIALMLTASSDVVAIIAVLAIFGLIPSQHRQVVVVVLIGAFLLNILVGQALLSMIVAQNSALPRWLASAHLAGIIEPVTTKFVPAIALLWYYRDRSTKTVRYLRENAWLSGAVLGFTIGVMEALMKVAQLTGMYADVHTVSVGSLVAATLHLFTGFLVAGAAFRWWVWDTNSNRRQELLTSVKILLPLVVAMTVHYWWNSGGLLVVNDLLGLS